MLAHTCPEPSGPQENPSPWLLILEFVTCAHACISLTNTRAFILFPIHGEYLPVILKHPLRITFWPKRSSRRQDFAERGLAGLSSSTETVAEAGKSTFPRRLSGWKAQHLLYFRSTLPLALLRNHSITSAKRVTLPTKTNNPLLF